MHLHHKNRGVERERPETKPKGGEDFNWTGVPLDKETQLIIQARQVLQKKIIQIENRLRFGYSEPLHEYKMELIKEDIGLSCKLTEFLIQSA